MESRRPPTVTDRLTGRANASPGFVAKAVFDDSVLKGVVGDHDESPTWTQHSDGCLKASLEGAEFIVDRNPKGLKNQSGGVVAATATDPRGVDHAQ